KRHKVLSVILVLLIALTFYIISVVNKAKDILSSNAFDYGTVEVKDLSNSVSATGKIVGLDKKNAATVITGVEFKEINIEVGDYVEEGQVIAVLDSSDIEENIEIAKKQMNASNSNNAISVGGAQRALSNAEVNRDKDAEKADVNIARAWDAYVNAANAAKEATDKYNDAVNARKSAEDKRNAAAGTLSASQSATTNQWADIFDERRTNLINQLGTYYISSGAEYDALLGYGVANFAGCNIKATPFLSAVDGNDPANAELYAEYLEKGLTDLKKNDGSALSSGEADTITMLINEMKNVSNQYATAVSASSANLATAETALASAKSTEAALKSAMDAADSTADSLYNTYLDMVRAKEDTKRMDDSTVATAVDSLNTTRNTASVSNLPSVQNIESLEEQVSKCTITAPMSGTVTAVNYKLGDRYDGMSPICVIEDDSKYQVSAEIDEFDIAKVSVGQKVKILTNGTGDTELEGVVKTIAPHATAALSATATNTAVTYNVLIDILTPNDDLKMDMTAKVTIVSEEKKNCKCLPMDAIQKDEDGKLFVELKSDTPTLGEDGKLVYEKVYVEKGMESDYYVEVISDELAEGTEVIIPSEYDDSLYDISWEVG
ncbi:MAG: HlyD family efflux transporter periplasmic adaptor subunit, partial [Lachnospiraceae bacterium]|nr:HlyD family efflux transporter periplasmic adaptor subunit [Lachnospiraceae bacterium]